MTRISLRITYRYLKENLGLPFIIGFQVLIMVIAISRIYDLPQAAANQIGIYALYFLAAGVLLQLVSYLRIKGRS